MNDSDLDKKLKAAPVPARDEDYWESFPRLVSAKLRTTQAGRPMVERHWLPRLAWGGGMAFACLMLGFALGHWHGQKQKNDPYALLQNGKMLREVLTFFPNRVRAIVQDEHGVQLVLAGHEHNYQRSKPMRAGVPVPPGTGGTVYMVSGGGGGPLHPVVPASFLDYEASVWHYLRVNVDGPKLTIHAIGTDGREFDQVVLTVPPSLILSNSVVDAASFTSSLAAGELVSIFGQGLASGTDPAPGFPLPTSLDGATVTLNGTPLALTYASPGQINAALPLDALGPATLRVTTPAGFAEVQINITGVAPAIFPSAITHADGSLVSATSPVTPGETLVIYMTGLGQVNGKLGAGQAAPPSPLLRVLAPVQVQIGATTPITPSFAGLTPGFVGVYQVNVAVPRDLPAMVYPLSVSENGISSNSQNIQVQSLNP